ncbi:Ank2 [Symbiodinium natans]|uniref:Ank2 protein n=1 Tax=Symbiodinium natans TaxID=878477 RepID=A0A812NWK5_9DINO|nr:Ank2 [Symbiodinium natans]
MVQELSSRQQHQVAAAHQKLQQNVAQDEQEAMRYEARFSSLEPSVQQLREELEQMRELMSRNGTDCNRRCEEAEEMCNKRLQGVQEAALSAARELWEEHQGVVAECKASLAALQQILDSKDKIATQLRSLQQQQREEDKQEFWTQFQMRHEHLQAKLADAERALSAEQNARIEEQQRAEGVVSRLGLALEKAQASWIKESAKLADQIHEAKRDFSIDLDGETKGVARRLADGLEVAQRQIDDLDRKILAAQGNLSAVSERLESAARAQNSELRDSEGRVMRQVSDVQTIQTGKTQQAVFDMRAELAKLDQAMASQVSSLRQAQEETEARAMAAVTALDARAAQRLQDSLDYERERGRQEQVRLVEEERGLRLRAEAERVASLQKRLKAHEDSVSQHFQGLKQDQIVTMTQLRERVDEAKRELLEDVQTAEDRLVRRLEEQLELERNKTREQIEAFIEEERSERIKAESERLGSLQKRLQAHEDLTTQRLAEHRQRAEAETGTLRRALEAQALQDKQDLQKEFQDFALEQRQATSSLSEDVGNLAGDCMKLNENLDALQRATDQRLAAEGAALAAQLSVAAAGLTASQQRATEALNDALKQHKTQLTDDVAKVSDELDKMNGEILKLIDDESNKVKEGHAAIESRIATLEMAFTARTQALGDVDAQLSAKLDDVVAASQEAMENLRDALSAETGKLVERFGQVQDDVQSIEAEVLRRCEDMGEAQAESKLAQDEMFGNLQANIGELGAKIDESKVAESDLQKAVAAAQAGVEAADTRASALEELLAQESTRASTAEESLTRTAEGLAAQQAKQGGEQLAMAEKLKELTQEMAGKFQSQQEAAEAHQAKLEARLDSEQKAAQDAQDKLKEAIEEARKAGEDLEAESNAVREVRKDLTKMTKGQCEFLGNITLFLGEAQAANAEDAVRQTRAMDELRKQLQTSDEECKKALATQEERAQAKERELQVEAVQKMSEQAQSEAAVARESIAQAAATAEAEKKAAGQSLEEELAKLRKTSEEALAQEAGRAQAAEKALQDSLDDAQKASSALAEKVQEAQTKAEQAEAEAAIAQESVSHAAASSEAEKKAADKSLEEELAKLRKESEEEFGKLREQLQKVEQTEKEASAAATEKEADLKKEKDKELEQQKADLEDLRKRLADAEASGETLKKEASESQELRQKAQEEQDKALQEMRQRLEELGGLSEAAAKGEEAANRCREEVDALQSKLAEEVGAVRLRMDGGFRALLQRSEAEKWLRENVDTVADGVSNAFLRLLDKSSEKLKALA